MEGGFFLGQEDDSGAGFNGGEPTRRGDSDDGPRPF